MTDRDINFPEGVYLDNILLRKCTTGICGGDPPAPEFSPPKGDAVTDFLQPFLRQFSGYRFRLLLQ